MEIACFTSCFQDEQNTTPLSNLLEIVNTIRSFGNRSFKQSHYQNAKDHYKKVELHCLCHCTAVVFFFFGQVNVYNVCFMYIYLYCINTQAVTLLGNRETQGDVERQKVNTALLPLYLNLSFVELRLDRPHKALKYGNKALEINGDSTKALFRCGQVRRDSCSDQPHCAGLLLSLL